MCERNSSESYEYSQNIHDKQEKIKELFNQIHQFEEELQLKKKQNADLLQLNKSVRKLPYSIYKQFVITTQEDGSVVDLIKKKSMEQNTFLLDSLPKKTSTNDNYQRYLLLKINGQRPSIYLSGNTQISTLNKLNLQKLVNQQRKSLENIAQIKQISQKKENQTILSIKSKIVEVKLPQLVDQKVKSSQLRQQRKKLLIFPPSPNLQTKTSNNKNHQNTGQLLNKKQQLPLSSQLSILSDDIKSLKGKIKLFNSVLSQRMLNQQNFNINDLSQIPFKTGKIGLQTNQKKLYDSETKINNLFEQNKFSSQKWKQQKEQYIDYIQNLQKQVQGYRNAHFSFTDKGEQSNDKNNTSPDRKNLMNKYLQNETEQKKDIADSLFKTAGLFESQISGKKQNGIEAVKRYNIFKSQMKQTQSSYFKNQYHVNDQKNRSKSKSSKIIYLRR